MGESAKGSEILAESLIHFGATTMFGVAGDTGVAFYDALYSRSSTLRHVLANDERGAAFMADVYARRTNRVGIVEVSSGGGATFVVGGLGEAFAASVPLLLISTDIHRTSRGSGALTEVDQLLLYSAVTKWRATVETAAQIPSLVERALTEAVTARPAPVALVIPEDVLDEEASVGTWPNRVDLPRERPAASTESIGRAAALLRAARRPALLVGSGIHISQAHEALANLADRAGIPVATTIHGKGAIAETSPWSLGTAGANGGRDYVNEYLQKADFVLFIGTRANSTDTNGFTAPSRHVQVAHIDIDPVRAGHNYPGSCAIVADARTAIEQLVSVIDWSPDGDVLEARRDWIARNRKSWEERWSARPALDSAGRALDPWRLIGELVRVAGRGVTIVADPGTPTPYLAARWTPTEPGRRLILPRGHGPMGYALPGAVGAAVADESPVIGVITDGSVLMACGALETAHRMNLPITYVLLNNGGFGWMKALQRLYFGGRYFATDLSLIDGAAIAAAFGLSSTRVSSYKEFAESLEAGLASGGPNLIEVRVPSEHEVLPPVAPWEAAISDERAKRPVY